MTSSYENLEEERLVDELTRQNYIYVGIYVTYKYIHQMYVYYMYNLLHICTYSLHIIVVDYMCNVHVLCVHNICITVSLLVMPRACTF